MELWIIYALCSGMVIGIVSFLAKIIAHKKLNKHRILLINQVVVLVLSGVYLLFNYKYVEIGFLLGLMIVLRMIFAVEKRLFIIESLKYIETSLFFPIHNIFKIFLSFFVGMLLFGEYLGMIEYIALGLGVVMILLLSSKENKKIQVDYKKGIILLILSNTMLMVSSTINKYISSINFDIPTYLFLSSIVGIAYLISTKKDIHIEKNKAILKEEIKYGLINGVLMYVGFFLILLSLRDGAFVLVQTIHSISIFIPIVLSVIFYKETLNLKKILAFLVFIIIVILLAYK